MKKSHPWMRVLWPMAIVVLGGCTDGPALVDVSGRVTIDGVGVGPGFIVTFVPDQGGRPSQGVTDAEGRYRVKFSGHRAGVIRGPHRVIVSWPYADGEGPPNSSRRRLPPAAESISDTPFSVDVQTATSFDIELTAAERRP